VPEPKPVVIAPKPVVIALVPRPTPAPRPAPAPASVVAKAPAPVAVPKPAAPAPAKTSAPVAILERPITVIEAPVEIAPERAEERESLAKRVAALPRVLLDTVAWGGFAAVVALIVIALSDVGMGRAALWAVGLSGIVLVAVAVMAVTGTHLDDLQHASGSAERPD
jgi:hypothetical protein